MKQLITQHAQNRVQLLNYEASAHAHTFSCIPGNACSGMIFLEKKKKTFEVQDKITQGVAHHYAVGMFCCLFSNAILYLEV